MIYTHCTNIFYRKESTEPNMNSLLNNFVAVYRSCITVLPDFVVCVFFYFW